MILMLTSKKYWSITEKQEDKIVSHHEPAKDLATVLTAIAPATSSV